MRAVSNAKPQQIESLLLRLRGKLANYQAEPEATTAHNSSFTPSSTSGFGAAIHGDGFGIPRGYGHRYDLPDDDEYARRVTTVQRTTLNERGSSETEMLLHEKEQTITELRETVGILELKVQKLEQLVHLKDNKIAALKQQVEIG